MIIVNIAGGLGNQMFQFAFGQSLEAISGTQVRYTIDTYNRQIAHNGFELDRVFGLKVPIASNMDLRAQVGYLRAQPEIRRLFAKYSIFDSVAGDGFVAERQDTLKRFQDRKLPSTGYFHGYWQSEKYFIAIRDHIRKCFSFEDRKSNILVDDNYTNISLHVRRGDYLNKNSIHSTCDVEYFVRALDCIENSLEKTRIYIFSDDLDWAVRALSGLHHNIHFVSEHYGTESFKDMFLMSQCDHHIISNSSFSWWGAWLNVSPTKRVVAPRRWFANQSIDIRDMLPKSWITV